MPLTDSEQHLVSLAQQGRQIAFAAALAILWTCESLAPMFIGRRRRLAHGAANIGLAVVNALIAYGAAFGVLHVTEWSRADRFGLLHRIDIPVWAHWALAILIFDCWQYWWHRFNHRVPLLWRFHAVHHSDAEMDATSGVRFHSIEIVFSFIARLAVLPLIGVTVPQLVVYEAVTLPIILFHHSNIRLPYRVDTGLRWLIVTPWMHWVHHSRWQPETDSNYSSFLSVWDRLCGSFRLRHEPQEIHMGLDGWQEQEWRGLAGMLLAPFHKAMSRYQAREPGDGES